MSIFSSLTNPASNNGQAQPGPDSLVMNILPIAIIFMIFYLLIIKPQQKKAKQHAEAVKSLARGDSVLTSGGIVATITKIDDKDNIIQVEIAPGVQVKIDKTTIISIIEKKDAEKSVKKSSKKEKK